MWIAKPVNALSGQEVSGWISWVTDRIRMGLEIPLSQSLTWGLAANSVGGRSFAVYNPDEGVGGIVLALSPREGAIGAKFECVNGPVLEWDDPSILGRQFATFALAASKLDSSFSSLTLRPRWTPSLRNARLRACPVPACGSSEAATLVVSLDASNGPLEHRFAPRLLRSIARTARAQFETRWEPFDRALASVFAGRMAEFARAHGFYSPPAPWFEALTAAGDLSSREGISFWLSSASGLFRNQALESQLVVAIQGTRAHYLFGLESRPERAPAALSPASLAQLRAMRECSARGARSYDLNGYVRDPSPEHSYLGVCRYKEQFRGEIVDYFVPEFVIS